MILLPRYSKLQRKDNESKQEWMGRFHIKVAKCNCKEYDRQLKEQFINPSITVVDPSLGTDGFPYIAGTVPNVFSSPSFSI